MPIRKRYSKKKGLIMVLFPLLLGSIIYYLFCPGVAFVKKIDAIVGVGIHFRITYSNWIISLIRNYLLDFLWAYSLTWALFLLCDNKKYLIVFTVIFPCALGLLFELMQKTKMVHGTADVFDVVAEIIGIVVANTIIKVEVRNENVD